MKADRGTSGHIHWPPSTVSVCPVIQDGLVAAEKQRGIGDLLRLAHAAPGNRLQRGVVERRIVCLALVPHAAGKLDRAGRDRVDANVLRHQHQRLRHRVVDDRGLHRGIGRRARAGAVAGDRGNVEDRTARRSSRCAGSRRARRARSPSRRCRCSSPSRLRRRPGRSPTRCSPGCRCRRARLRRAAT